VKWRRSTRRRRRATIDETATIDDADETATIDDAD
jgi:hypothetical protein